MELKAAIKILRKELALTQSELAKELHVTFATVNRWETGKTIPDTTATEELLALCKRKSVSTTCYRNMKKALENCRKETMHLPSSELYAVERESICQLVDNSVNGCYVADLENDELLYVNHQAEFFFGKEFNKDDDVKCYEFFADRSNPCVQCPKAMIDEVGCSEAHVLSAKKDRYFHVRGKKIVWNGRKAHVQYFQDETNDREAQNRISHLVNTVNVGIYTAFLYEDGRIEVPYLNEGFFTMVGTNASVGRTFRYYTELPGMHPDDIEDFGRKMMEAYRNGTDFKTTFRRILPDKSVKWLSINSQLINKNDKRCYYAGTITDVDKFYK